MDAAQRRTEMNELLGRIPDQTRKADISARFDAALAAWEAAPAEEKEAHATKLDALRAEAQQAAAGGNGNADGAGRGGPAGNGGRDSSFMSNAGFYLVVAVTLAAGFFVFFYFDEPRAKNFTPDGTVRPLLVLTLIIAMLGFGGLLIVRALFAPESFDKLSERFRLAREIFLVFAGTFGTIVGFYFGSEADDDGGQTAPTVEVSYADGRVTATVSGGHAPFMGIYTPRGQSGGSTMTADGRTLTFAVPGTVCPAGAEVEVIDGRGRRVESTVACEDDPPETTTGAPAQNPPPKDTEPVSNGGGNVTNEQQ